MSKKSIFWAYLALILLLVLVAIGITLLRGGADLRPVDPKLTLGLTVITLINVVQTFWMVVGLNFIAGFAIKHPLRVVMWIPLGTGLVLVMHHLIGGGFGLMGLVRIGYMDAFLMYLPAVGLMSLVGGLLGNLLRSQR